MIDLCLIANPNSVVILRMLNYFKERGYKLSLIGDHPPQGLIPTGIDFYDLTSRMNWRKLRYLFWGMAVRRLIRRINPDVLHAFSVTSAGWIGWSAGFHPWLVTAMGSDLLLLNRRSWVYRKLSLAALQDADHIACYSNQLAQIAASFGVSVERLEVIPVGVDTHQFHPGDKESSRKNLGVGAKPVILSIRAIQSIYNPLQIARAIPLVLSQLPQVYFVILTFRSDPQILKQFQTIIEENGASDSVRYVDELKSDQDIAAWYQASDLAISIPSSDGTPPSVLESMACGLPVILSDLPSLHDWVSDGEQGLFLLAVDAQALSDAIIRLLKDEELRVKMSQKAVETITEKGDFRYWMRKYEMIYQKLAGGT